MKDWIFWATAHPWKVFFFALWMIGWSTALDYISLHWLPTVLALFGVSLGTLLLIKERDMS